MMGNKEIMREVKLEGTPFDRRCKMTNSMIDYAKRLLVKGISKTEVAKILGVNVRTLRYATEPDYKEKIAEQDRERKKRKYANMTREERQAFHSKAYASSLNYKKALIQTKIDNLLENR